MNKKNPAFQKHSNVFNVSSIPYNLLSLLSILLSFAIPQINSYKKKRKEFIFSNFTWTYLWIGHQDMMAFWIHGNTAVVHNALNIVFQSARNVRWRRFAIPRLLFRNYNHSLLLYFLVADPRLFLVSPAGIRRRSPQQNEYSVRRVPHDLIRRCQADPGSKTGRRAAGRKRWRATYALFICLRCTPKGTCSGLDFDEFNLAFAQGSERAEWD